MFQRFYNFVLPYRKTEQTEKSSQTFLFLLHHPQQDIQITGIIRWKKNTFHVESWKCVNRVEGTRMYFPFARKMVTKQVRCKILGILCWRTVERPRNASEKEWSRQPQSCLSAVGLTGLGSQSKKRPCSVAMSTRCVYARLSSSLRDSCAHTRLVLSSASCPLSPDAWLHRNSACSIVKRTGSREINFTGQIRCDSLGIWTWDIGGIRGFGRYCVFLFESLLEGLG